MITVTVEGLSELRAAVRRAPTVADRSAAKVAARISSSVAAIASSLAPVATGTLRGSITHQAAGVFVGADYWRHVEYGTRYMAAQPFIRPAAELERAELDERAHEIGEALERDWNNT